ncbi:DNA polymerase type-B epsilon [Encephalitozoon intestinalis ATCC 50506]|uniref:DNA polymerase epsilon catalytic subunit n=1 Tax=Encephalitozoon intestinalis (strain ATCC 50506) TaxID=876142 RepID=E0S9Q6_ENCIT|nr:DNA polymerase type-B epsilon [Encephalitozoon intestinalis ATCC 50506]ADM12441.1 DNA polymerase type-B epsilon [Encephalitozoon intestinalis ATCC 50506]UTX46277.1 DNA polymerase type-B epsilon [Encephalitozoon intestinalis]
MRDELLEEQYGFISHHESRRREGWVLNYITTVFKDGRMEAKLYLIDDKRAEFLVKIPYFPSLLLKASDYDSVEEYLRRKYAAEIYSMERVHRIDFNEYNHLNKDPGVFLEVRFRTESGFSTAVKDFKKIVARNKVQKNNEYDCFGKDRTLCAEELMEGIFEYDIPVEVCTANNLKIRCGKWYTFYYTGETYVIEKSERVVFPDLRILAFDIETFKKPLKFPNPDYDEVMMISVKTECRGELIVNRRLVSKDIRKFEYNPREDMECVFDVSNEGDEEGVLIRFVELIQKHKPHLITTFNGALFDFPFLEKRMKNYGISLRETTGFTLKDEYYISPFIVHLDCYKWVKRDSYLPAGSQGLKEVTKVKLGYFPDEIDPEDMVRLAMSDPDKMASYSVSDSVATYFLYTKYVQPHVFSLCSLVPLSPTSALCQGSGTLCEALLVSEAIEYGVLIPERRRESKTREHNGHIAESITYVGGYVECLRSGIFRSDLEHEFNISKEFIGEVVSSLDEILYEYKEEGGFEEMKAQILANLQENKGRLRKEGLIYHLDVGAMYPNIILTNKLQPVSIVNEEICIRCDFSDESNNCKKRMEWSLKVEYIPAGKRETEMIRRQVEKEKNFEGNEEEEVKKRVRRYSKSMYGKKREKKICTRSSTVCQREIPFYVETVRKFRDQRYVYKRLQAQAQKAAEEATTDEERKYAMKSVVVYSSLQVAHKCVLNSFYGYVMRKSSRWYSMEMAAIVCNVGGNIIKKAREIVEKIGISLELDTDGIWCIVPSSLVSSYVLPSGKKFSLLSGLLNHFVCKKFTNNQYQEKIDGEYATRSENSIFFEIDGPYRAMLLPTSTEESKLLKKRYAIIDDNNKIAELKGFEMKRRGELQITKKFQEELFLHFLDGSNLNECYESLAEVCRYWLDILKSKGEYLDDDTILELLSESRSMSKGFGEYRGRKSNLTVTAVRMSEVLGEGILEEKLKCEYIVAAYPENKSVAERAIPVVVFRSEQKEEFLRKWLERDYSGDIRAVIDWEYYRVRLECVIQRMVILPALSQGIKNPLSEVGIPEWAKAKTQLRGFDLRNVDDIEDAFCKARLSKDTEAGREKCKEDFEEDKENCKDDEKKMRDLMETDVREYILKNRIAWIERIKRIIDVGDIIKMVCSNDGYMDVYRMGRSDSVERIPLERRIYMQVNDWRYFDKSGDIERVAVYFPENSETTEVGTISIKEHEFVKDYSLYRKFLSHFSIRRVFEDKIPILYSNLKECEGHDVEFVTVGSFIFLGKPVYTVGEEEFLVFSGKEGLYDLGRYLLRNFGKWRIGVIGSSDPCKTELRKILCKYHILEIQVRRNLSLKEYSVMCNEQKEFHKQMAREVELVCKLSKYSRIPIFNVNENVMDVLFYRELKKNRVVCGRQECEMSYSPRLRAESFRPGLYKKYVVEIECIGTLVLSIIEYEAFLGKDTLFKGVERKDFHILRSLLKRIVLDSIKGEDGAKLLLRNIGRWIRSDSAIICSELRSICCMLQKRYMMHLAKKLRDEKYDVICVAGDVVLIDTGKTSEESALDFFQYICKKGLELCGYEMMKMKAIRIFQSLAFVDPSTYFFLDRGEYFCFSESKVPTAFLQAYFNEEKVDSEFVYSLVTKIPLESSKMVLKLLSFRQDSQALLSNCYKLLHLSEFAEKERKEIYLDIVCPSCGMESALRARCIKCYNAYPKSAVLEVCMAYAKHLLWLELSRDLSCTICGKSNEARLSSFCKCGGAFQKTSYGNELESLREIAGSPIFDGFYRRISKHFLK